MVKLFAGLVLAAALTAQVSEDEMAVRRQILRQMAAWNRGDIRGFMEIYDNSPNTLYVGAQLVRGYETVLQSYLKRYPTPERMGKVNFYDLEVRPLGTDHSHVLGRWKLERTKEAGGTVGGVFTLIFKKISGEWKVIVDHTSVGS